MKEERKEGRKEGWQVKRKEGRKNEWKDGRNEGWIDE